MLLGAHESIAGGLSRALARAEADGCQALQIFTKNSGAWKEPELADDAVAEFRRAHRALGKPPVMAHTSYLINLATDDPALLARSKDALAAEVARCSALGIAFVVLHPGAHLGAGVDRALSRVAESLDDVIERAPKASARILIENTAGQGTCVGCRFDEIGAIFERTKHRAKMGVCFDTQHAFAAGYDLRSDEGYSSAFADFDRHVGLSRLRAFHLNDSKKPLGARVDRHEHVGEGELGAATFVRLVNDARFKDTPAVLEVEPRGDKDLCPYKEEVSLLKSFVGRSRPPRKRS
jgi:deoxyribonuclease-4